MLKALSKEGDSFLSEYDFEEIHERVIPATVEETFQAFQSVDFSESGVLRVLFALRGISKPEKFQKKFVTLYENAPHEVVWGLVARPWKLKGDVLFLTSQEFKAFDTSGYVKILWGFSFTSDSLSKGCRVQTVTRIKATDKASLRKFRLYWFFIRPFSGFVRKVMLRLILKQVKKVA
ncbi:MAG: hypothetical protein KDK62_01040 [Chlamydiia bacterium]|nr:hypothetical protein [Chlamydiia bacterium]